MESSLARRAAALSRSRSAAPTALAFGSFDLASTLSGIFSGSLSARTPVFFPPQPHRIDRPRSKAVPVDR